MSKTWIKNFIHDNRENIIQLEEKVLITSRRYRRSKIKRITETN